MAEHTSTKAHTTTRKHTDEANRGPVCATPGCHGYQDQHAQPGNTCWCAINCPCTRFAPSKAVIKARELAHAADTRQHTDEELTGMTIASEVIPTDAHYRAPGAAGASAVGGSADGNATTVDGTGGNATTDGVAGAGATASSSGGSVTGG